MRVIPGCGTNIACFRQEFQLSGVTDGLVDSGPRLIPALAATPACATSRSQFRSYAGFCKLAVVALAFSCSLHAADVRFGSIEPSALFVNREPLRQVAFVTVWNGGAAPVQADVTVRIEGMTPGPAVALTLDKGATQHRVLVPDITKPASVTFELRASKGGDVIDTRVLRWEPQRKWKVFIVRSSHEDLGYEDYIFRKQREIADFIDLARGISGHSENLSEQERQTGARYQYAYTMETLLFQRNYIEERGESAWRRVVNNDIKHGRIHLMGAPSGVHSHWMDYEELARMTYPARRETLDRFGLDLKTFMIVDNPSLSWSGAQVLANAGFRYVARWGQSWRTAGNNDYTRTKVPALFWWKTPDGSRVLFGWRSHYYLPFWYGHRGAGYGGVLEAGSENVSRLLKRIESGEALGPYPYDAVINPEYVDHDIPDFDARTLGAWRQSFAYPVIKVGSPDEFFEYIEKTYGDILPELTGDLNNFSADYASIDPESQGWKRRAARVLPLAESLAAISSLLDPAFKPVTAEAARIWTRMFDYNEHSWPTLPPATDVQLFNANWVKKHEAQRALDAATRILKQSWTAVARQIPAGPERTIAVFNPLAHARDDIVAIEGSFGDLVESATGERVPVQTLPNGKSVFIAKGVPAFGYRVFRAGQAPAKGESSALEASADTIANQFYRIRFEVRTGTIASIVDKKTGRELVDSAAKHKFNQMVYVHKNGREMLDGFEYVPGSARKTESRKGPVRAEFDVWIDDEKTGAAIRQSVVLYDGIPRIDIINDLRHVKALHSERYEDRYKDNLFYAFPLAVPGGQPRVEYPGGVVRPWKDQMRWGSHDYLHANRWVDVSNSSFGVSVVPWNAATFHFGEIRYNRFSIDYQPASPHLYSYAYSNRMAGLLTLNADDCNATLGYSILAHEGDWNSGETTRFAWSVASPLEPFVLQPNQTGKLDGKRMSFGSVDAANVQMTVLKTSEQPGRGYVARFVETEGRDTAFTFQTGFFPIQEAFECDLVENDRNRLAVDAGQVRLRVKPYGFATVRMVGGAAPVTPDGIMLKPLTDDQIAVSWKPVQDAAGYFVYRSDDPDAPPTAYSLVARTTEPAFRDTGLHVGTRYTYRISAVSSVNMQSQPSSPESTRTSASNTTPPAPVEELGVIRRSKDKLMVYWRKSPELDVARYYLYRGLRSDFDLATLKPLAVLKPSGDFLEMYIDTGLEPGKTYFYKVVAEDWAANRQRHSATANATTPAY